MHKIAKNTTLFALLALFSVSSFLAIILNTTSVMAADGYQQIERIFFPADGDSEESTFADIDRNEQILETYFSDVDTRIGGDVGYTETKGIGLNCNSDESNGYGVLCDQYYVLNNSSFVDETDGLLIFHNVRKYTDELGTEAPTITYFAGTGTYRVDEVGGATRDVSVSGNIYNTRNLVESFTETPPSDGNGDETDEDEDEATKQTSCEDSAGSFSFVLCPFLYGLDAAVNGVDSAVNSLLTVDYERYTASGSIERAWAQIRNIAYVLLIPTMLIMVIGTALGFNFLDAYTVKRALPRMVAAIIFIALSWDICLLLIEITNTVGQGIAGLIGAAIRPDGGLMDLQLRDIFTPSESVATTLIGAGAGSALIVGGIVLAAIGGGVLLSVIGYVLLLLLAAFLSLTIAFLLLALRQMLIIALILLGPLAILAWIFPGNDKPWKFWWNSFSKLLLLYPLIITLIVTGRGFAWVIFETGGASNGGVLSALIDFTLKFVAYIGPYFMIPAAFKLAGSTFASLSGMVNDKSRGLFDRNRKRRAQLKGYAGKKTKEKAANGALFNPSSRMGKKFNTRAEDLTNLSKINSLSSMKTDLARARSISAPAHTEHAMEDEDMNLFNRDELGGVRADLSTGNREGFVSNATVQIRKKLIKDRGLLNAEGEFSGTAAQFDSITQEAARQATTLSNDVFDMQSNGNEEGAYKKALETWGVNSSDQNTAWSTIKRLESKHSRHALDQAFVLKAMAGGTYYADDYSTWRAAGLSTHGDSNAKGNMVVQGRKALMGAGRALEGGGGFGDTFAMQEAASTTTDAAKVSEIKTNFKKKVIAANGISVLLHQSNKDGFTEENLIPMIQQEIQDAYDSQDEQRINRVTAQAEVIHKQLGQTKPAFQKMFAEQVMSYSPDAGRVLTTEDQIQVRDVREQYSKDMQQYQVELQTHQQLIDDIRSGKSFDSNGKALPKLPTDGQGNLVLPPPPTKPPEPKFDKTVRVEVHERTSDPIFQNYSYQFEVAERQYQAQQAAAAQAAAAQAAGGAGAGQITPPPGAGTPGGP